MNKTIPSTKAKSKDGFWGYAERTARYLKRKFREALIEHGNGDVGLLPGIRAGYTLQRFSDKTLELARLVIKTVWMTQKAKSKKAAFGEFLIRAKRARHRENELQEVS